MGVIKLPSYFNNSLGFPYIPKSPCDDGYGNLIRNNSGYDLIADYWLSAEMEYFWLTGSDLLSTQKGI